MSAAYSKNVSGESEDVCSKGIEIVMLALARNCGTTLPFFFSWLRELEQDGLHHTTWVGENGSSDDTRSLLDEAAAPNFHVIDTGFMAVAPDRLTRMALGRQALLDVVSATKPTAPFICVLDLDNVMLRPPSPTNLRKALCYLQDSAVFAVGATSSPYYYDLLSLKTDRYDGRSLHSEINSAKKHPTTYFRFYRDKIYKVQRSLDVTVPLVCDSSFNGLCLYKKEAFLKGTYRSPEEALVCEHVSLNMSIGQVTGASMLVVPELRLRMPSDHGPVGFFGFWIDRILKTLKR